MGMIVKTSMAIETIAGHRLLSIASDRQRPVLTNEVFTIRPYYYAYALQLVWNRAFRTRRFLFQYLLTVTIWTNYTMLLQQQFLLVLTIWTNYTMLLRQHFEFWQ